jgi:hypothetical protein
MNSSLPPALPTGSPLPPASPNLKTRSTAITAAIACMILTVASCFVPIAGWYLAGTFGAIALIMIIVAMAQGDRRGLPLLITHIIATPLACLFATIVSCGAILGTMGAGVVTATTTQKGVSGSSANRYPTPPVGISSPARDLKIAVAAGSPPEHTVAAVVDRGPATAAASTPEPTVDAAGTGVFEKIPSKSVVCAITSNQWSSDALIVSGKLTNTTAMRVNIANLSTAGFDKDQKAVIEASDNTIDHHELAPGETVAFTVTLKDATKQVRFVKVTPDVAGRQ